MWGQTYQHLAALVFFPFVFGEMFPTAEFWMKSAETPCWEIFTFRSTFLYSQSFRGRRHITSWYFWRIIGRNSIYCYKINIQKLWTFVTTSEDWDTLLPMLSSGRYCWQGSPLWLFTVLFSPCAETSAFQQSWLISIVRKNNYFYFKRS